MYATSDPSSPPPRLRDGIRPTAQLDYEIINVRRIGRKTSVTLGTSEDLFYAGTIIVRKAERTKMGAELITKRLPVRTNYARPKIFRLFTI